jgi:dihydroneopterin aldolase / 2-amino-4-hydroxy-6-hydroxymethyldihydropteridine diphosphokinase
VTDHLELRGMRFTGTHGVLADEHVTPQRFEVDVILALDLRAAGQSDDLDRTVDYGSVFRVAEATIQGPHVELIETLAERIASQLLADHPGVEAVTVRVRKPDAPLPGQFAWAGVEISRRR